MENVPKHIAIILDGNRRFARRLMMKPWKGHEWGKEKVSKLIEWCKDLSIREITLYAFSIDNFQRPKEEFDYLMKIFKEASQAFLTDPRVEEYQLRVRFIGRIDMFPSDLVSLIQQVMDKTKKHEGIILNLAMAYGGRQEIIDAVRELSREVKEGKVSPQDITEEIFASHLYLKDTPDLIIRTGGEQRLSNFLSWQSTYSELFFLEKMWPDFEKEDLVACIDEYRKRERRFGK